MLVSDQENFGRIELRINDILKEKRISKNRICKDMDIPRANFNRYCKNSFQRIDANLICKLCYYLGVDVGDLIVYKRPENE
ncbi:MAG: helix-turn-helix transcriptional regulator [Clostridia bacterium]|nr:helix-turn-helix transcriptional regulator [Clostridia bacterium]